MNDTLAAELEAVRAERDRLRLTLTGTRAALDLVQEECDAAHERLHAAKSDLAAVEGLHDRIADERNEAWAAYRRAADDRDKAEAALAESEDRGDEWSRVAHQWAMQRDDARRRAEEAERVIEAYRGHPLRLEDRA